MESVRINPTISPLVLTLEQWPSLGHPRLRTDVRLDQRPRDSAGHHHVG
jgi:hypothetical protein